MSLSLATLQDELLQRVFNIAYDAEQSRPEQFAAMGTAWADAYGLYAQNAQSCGGVINPAVLGAQKQALAGTMAAAQASAVEPSAAAQGIVAALGAFWVNPLLWLPLPPAGPATLVVPVGAPVLLAGLLQLFAAGAAGLPAGVVPTKEDSALQLAALLDAYTRAVTVTHTLTIPPFTCVAPIF